MFVFVSLSGHTGSVTTARDRDTLRSKAAQTSGQYGHHGSVTSADEDTFSVRTWLGTWPVVIGRAAHAKQDLQLPCTLRGVHSCIDIW